LLLSLKAAFFLSKAGAKVLIFSQFANIFFIFFIYTLIINAIFLL
jgi:hypothetical protein